MTHTEKHLVGISPTGIELMFSEYILGQYLTVIFDVISRVEEGHEIMPDKGSLSSSCQKNNPVLRN